jgi:hypothetical protein
MVALLLVSAVAPAAVTAQTEESLSVDVTQDETGTVAITVTDNGTAVENATVNVTANTTYADAGEFETDANGMVTLDNPEETVELTLTATDRTDTASTTVIVEPVQTLAVGVEQDDDGTVTVSVDRLGEPVTNATVTVEADENDTYAGAGEYETDESGTVVLPAPSENVTVSVTATDDGETATTTADLAPPEPIGPFGQVVSAFVDALKGAGFTGIGSQVSDFVTSNNPSNEAGNSDAVAPPEAGNSAPVTPPGQEKKDDNDSRVVPAEPPVENPGNSDSVTPPGQSGDENPGNSGDAPGQSGDDEDEDANDERDDANGNGGDNASGNGNAGGNGNGR